MRGTKLYVMFAAMFMTGAFLASPELRVYAANTVGSADIINNSILSADIKDGEVKTVDLGNDAVTSAKIKNGEVQTDDIAPGAIGSLRIKDNDVKAQDIAPNAVGASEIADGTITYADASRSFVKIEHRDDCNCGGTGWDPNGQHPVEFVYDDAARPDSVIAVSLTGANIYTCSAHAHGGPGSFSVKCNAMIVNGVGLNYAIFNK